MNFETTLSRDGTYVIVRVKEDISAEMEREFAEQAIRLAKKHNIKRFLVDVRGIPNVAGSLDNYLFAYEDITRFGLDATSRIAVLASPDDRSHDFIETVLRNAGYNCRMFSAEKNALEWFRK